MSVIDEKQLDILSELIGGDRSSLVELIETFLEEGRDMMVEMNDSLGSKDIDTLRRCSHSMKSSSQDFGAVALSELNATLESQCKNGWPSTASQQVNVIADNFEEASKALSSYISQY